jgi:hypothetical protein
MLLLLDASGHVAALLPPSGRLMLSRHLEAAPLAVNLNSENSHACLSAKTAARLSYFCFKFVTNTTTQRNAS